MLGSLHLQLPRRSPTLCNNKISIWVFAAVSCSFNSRIHLWTRSLVWAYMVPGPRDARVDCTLSLSADYAQCLGRKEEWRRGGETVWFALLSLPSRNSSNKCTFHTKGFFISSCVKPRSSPSRLQTQVCDPKAIPLQMPSSEDGLKFGSCQQYVWQQPVCLYLLSNLQAFISIFMTVMGNEVLQRERERERADDTVVLHPPLNREFARSCEL